MTKNVNPLVSTPDGIPIVAPIGADDGIADAQLAQAREAITSITAEENLSDTETRANIEAHGLRDALSAAVEAIAKCRALQVRARGAMISAYNKQADGIERGAAAARSTAEGSRSQLDAVATRYRQSAVAALRASVGEKYAERAEALGAAAADACIAAERRIKAVRVAFAYRAMTDSVPDLATALQRERLSVEIRNKGVASLFSTYQALLSLGDEERLIALEDASEQWLHELASSPAQRLAQRKINGRVDSDVQEEQSKAIALLREISKRREARIPAGIRIAEACMTQLVIPSFAAIVGTRAWDLTREEMQTLLSVDGAQPFSTWTIRPNWFLRGIDGRPTRPVSGQPMSPGATEAPPRTVVVSG